MRGFYEEHSTSELRRVLTDPFSATRLVQEFELEGEHMWRLCPQQWKLFRFTVWVWLLLSGCPIPYYDRKKLKCWSTFKVNNCFPLKNKSIWYLGWSRLTSLVSRSMWIFTVISILMLILWTGWLCAVSQRERRDVHAEDTEGKPFFVGIVMQIRSSSQPECGESHNLRM